MSSTARMRASLIGASPRGRRGGPRDRARTSSGAPSAMTRPWWSTVMRWAIENTTSMSCSVKSRVRPRSRASRSMSAMASRVSVGRHAGGGLVEQQDLRLEGQRDAQLELLLAAVGEEARRPRPPGRAGPPPPAAPPSRRDRGARPASRRFQPRPRWETKAAWTFSNTVSRGKMLVRWNERPMPRRQRSWGAMPVTSRPLKIDAGRRRAGGGR